MYLPLFSLEILRRAANINSNATSAIVDAGVFGASVLELLSKMRRIRWRKTWLCGGSLVRGKANRFLKGSQVKPTPNRL